MTSRGFKEEEMIKIADWMKKIASDFENNKESVAKEVIELTKKFPIY